MGLEKFYVKIGFRAAVFWDYKIKFILRLGTEFNLKDNFMALSPKFRGLLNSQNTALWEYLSAKYDLRLDESPENCYLTYFDHDTVVVEVDMADINPSGFTHELLHVYMKDRGIHMVRDLKTGIQADKDLQELFSTSLRVHIGNCLEHVKMLPIFLELGFENERFIGDYDIRIMDETQIDNLEEQYYFDGRPELKSVDYYLGKYFSMKASNNPAFDYTNYCERLETIDRSLFGILERFWNSWLAFDLESAPEYVDFLDRFLREIKHWKNAFQNS